MLHRPPKEFEKLKIKPKRCKFAPGDLVNAFNGTGPKVVEKVISLPNNAGYDLVLLFTENGEFKRFTANEKLYKMIHKAPRKRGRKKKNV